MGVGPYRDDFTAQFPVTTENGGAGIGFPQTLQEPAGIEFNAFAGLNQPGQDFVEDIPVLFISVAVVFLRAIAHNIIQMAVNIEIVKGFQVVRNGCKVFQIGFFLCPPFIKGRIVRVPPVAEVRRSNDEVIVMGAGEGGVFQGQMRL